MAHMTPDERLALTDKLSLAVYQQSPDVTLSLAEVTNLVALLDEQKRSQVSIEMLRSFAGDLQGLPQSTAVQFAIGFMVSLAKTIEENGKAVLVDVDAIGRMYLYIEARGWAVTDAFNEPETI